MDPKAMAYLGAGIGAGLTIIGGAAGIGRLAAAAMEGIARQPNAAGDIRGAMIVAAGLIEGVTFFSLIVAIFAFVLGKFAWGPLLAAIEGREKSVRDHVDGASKANAEAQALLAQHKEMLREAGREREEILARAL